MCTHLSSQIILQFYLSLSLGQGGLKLSLNLIYIFSELLNTHFLEQLQGIHFLKKCLLKVFFEQKCSKILEEATMGI